jgi:iron complex outermembrane receptor protein
MTFVAKVKHFSKGGIIVKKIFMYLFTVILGSGFVIGDLPSAFGQETGEFTLEEITVTAQKRLEDSQKVPIALSTLSGDQIAEMGGTTLKDSLNTLASVTIMQVNEGLNVSIRGMDNDGMPGDSAGMVGITVDGVSSNNFATGYSGLYDVSRVEVLSGPQGTLYSRNSGGGVVNMITNDPNTAGFDAMGSIEIGNYNTLNAQAAINAPVNEKSALRLALSTTDRDGYIDNGTDDNDSKSMRLKYLYNFHQDMSAVLSYENVRTSGKGQGREGVKPFVDEDDVENPWTGTYDGEYFYNDIDSNKYSMTLTWNTGIGQLTFLPSYTSLDRKFGTPQANRQTGEVGQNNCVDTEEETSGELRMNSSADSVGTWVMGLYYYRKKWSDVSASPSDLNYNILDNPTAAVFGNLTYPLSDRFRATVGGRYTKDHEQMEFEISDAVTNEVRMYENWDVKSSHFDYKLGIEYDLSGASMIWLENSTGYRQGYRGSESQDLNAYQIGIKNRFMDQRLQLNATAYYYDYTNYQVRSMLDYVDPETGAVWMDFGAGTGDATVYGLDFDTQFLFTKNDLVTFSGSYLHSAVSGLTIEYQFSPPSSQYEEAPLNNSPEWTLTGGYKHYFYLGNGGTFTAGFDLRYRTEYYCSFQDYIQNPNDRTNWEPNHMMANAALNYASPDGKWSINAYMKNIENHAEKVGKMMSSLRLSAPRTFGAVLSLRF